MDIVSHGIWSMVAGELAGRKLGRPIKRRWLFFWGVFPDLFAFGIPFAWLFVNILSGEMTFTDMPRPGRGGASFDWNSNPVYALAPHLYDFSHSIFIFVGVFLLIWFARSGWKRWSRAKMPWPLLGWGLHIVMDIPTHSYKFFPTPVFWPFSDWKFNGISWSQPWFLMLNYGLLTACLIYLRQTETKRKTARKTP